MSAKEEITVMLATMERRCEALGGRVPPEEVAWFKQRLSELNYHVNRLFGSP